MKTSYKKIKDSYKTERLTVRPLKKSDFPVWLAALQTMKPAQSPYDFAKTAPKKITKAQFDATVALHQYYRRRHLVYYFGAFQTSTGHLLGQCTIAAPIRFNIQSARISYTIFNQYWKSGFGHEVTKGLIEYAFKVLKLHRLEAEIDAGNLPSKKLIQKLGFQSEGVRREAVFLNQRWLDAQVFSLVRSDFGLEDLGPIIKLPPIN
jgi:[ribosomal protein S5]-alanine N-acetyltransferase